MSVLQHWLPGLAATFALALLAWALATARRNAGLVDIFWSLFFLAAAMLGRPGGAAVLERFSLSTKKQRETLLRIFDQLTENPFLEGEFAIQDSSGRPLQVRRFGFWIVTYWSEHISRQVHILSVTPPAGNLPGVSR